MPLLDAQRGLRSSAIPEAAVGTDTGGMSMSQYSHARTCRRVMRASVFVLVLFAVLFGARTATAVTIVDLGTLGGTFSDARAVNARGQVVGASTTAGNAETRAFSWTPAGGVIDSGA